MGSTGHNTGGGVANKHFFQNFNSSESDTQSSHTSLPPSRFLLVVTGE